jgi:hypothetical protein
MEQTRVLIESMESQAQIKMIIDRIDGMMLEKMFERILEDIL